MATKVKIETAKGVMIAELYDTETPITVNNFKKLIGERFYDGLNFHRVIPNFMIQGGCPNKNGSGGPGYTIQCEVSAQKVKLGDEDYLLFREQELLMVIK